MGRKASPIYVDSAFRGNSASPRGRGVFLALVGPDGSGKSTLAAALADLMDVRLLYFHFRPWLFRQMAHRPNLAALPVPKPAGTGSRVTGWLRLGLNLIRFWAGYGIRIWPALRRGQNVVADRWAYGYLVQPEALKFSGPEQLARLAIKWFPQPDLVVNLVAPAGVIASRKGELSISQIERELAEWAQIPCRALLTLDATQPPQYLAATIAEKAGMV